MVMHGEAATCWKSDRPRAHRAAALILTLSCRTSISDQADYEKDVYAKVNRNQHRSAGGKPCQPCIRSAAQSFIHISPCMLQNSAHVVSAYYELWHSGVVSLAQEATHAWSKRSCVFR